MQFRDYQRDIIERGVRLLKSYGFVYLAMEVRTGKTLTSLGICQAVGARNVLFLTKKKAIGSIEGDYAMLNPTYNLTVTNYESMHKIPNVRWDIIIFDEAHSLGAFPKPNKRAKDCKDLLVKTRARGILLSGTPTPESFSQMYHQVYGFMYSPFSTYANFYRFADQHIDVKQKKVNGLYVRDYTHGKQSIIDAMKPYTISFSQKDAGFVVSTYEEILRVRMNEVTYALTKQLKKNLVVEGKDEVILADTPVKLMQKLHQLFSGTVKFESGNSMIIDKTKAEFIKEYFDGKKIGIFYKFKEELNALKSVFGEALTTELSLFKETDCKVIALQIVSGREGISLQEAEALVYYNIDFSATSYWQSRDRMTTKDRLENNVYWVFSEGGIEDQIYKAVVKKKDYTLSHFKRDLLTLF